MIRINGTTITLTRGDTLRLELSLTKDGEAYEMQDGDVYDVQSTGVNYAWTGTAWDALGQYVDVSVLWTSTTGQANTLEAMTVAEINAILNPSA